MVHRIVHNDIVDSTEKDKMRERFSNKKKRGSLCDKNQYVKTK